jgi:hypothetical protein
MSALLRLTQVGHRAKSEKCQKLTSAKAFVESAKDKMLKPAAEGRRTQRSSNNQAAPLSVRKESSVDAKMIRAMRPWSAP